MFFLEGLGENVHACQVASVVSNSLRLFVTSWTIALQAPPSMGFFRQEYQHGLPFPSLGDLPDPGIIPTSLMFPLSMGFSRQEYWSGFPCPPPGDLPNPGTEPTSLISLHWQVSSLPLVLPGKPLRGEYVSLTIPAPQGHLHSLLCDHICSSLCFCHQHLLLLTPHLSLILGPPG